MNVMRRFTLRSLGRNKKRTIVTIIGVIISVAMITAVAALFYSFANYLQQGAISENGNWHAELLHVPADKLGIITGDEAVDKVVISREAGYAQIPDSQSYSKQYLCLNEYAPGGFEQMSVRLKEGRLPEKAGEVLISQSIFSGSDLEYSVGDTITLNLGDIITPHDGTPLEGNEFLSNKYDENGEVIAFPVFEPRDTVALTVVGIMERPGFEKSWSAGYGLLGYLDEDKLSPSERVNTYIAFSTISRNIYKQVGSIMDKMDDAVIGGVYNDDLLRCYGVVEWDNVYLFLQGFMLVIMIIIVVASISLIYNAFAMSVSERGRQLGLLASVGATRRQKRASVYFEGFFVGAIGIPLGILAGIGGIGITLAAVQPLLDDLMNVAGDVKLTLVVPLPVIAITVLFSVLTIFISVYRPARRASKITPIEAIRQSQEVRLTRKSVRTSKLTRRIFGFEAEIALKNLKRSRKKYRATVVSLVISLVLFLTVSSYTSVITDVSYAADEGYNYDIMLQYNRLTDAQRDDANAKIASLDLVNSFSALSELRGTMEVNDEQLSDTAKNYFSLNGIIVTQNFQTTIIGLDEASFELYAAAVGTNAEEYRDVQNPKAILINYGQAYINYRGNNAQKIVGDILKVKPGDIFPFSAGDDAPEEGKRDADTQITIGAVTQARPMGVMTGYFGYVTLVVPDNLWDSIVYSLNTEPLKTPQGQNPINYEAYISTDDDQKLESQMEELLQGLPMGTYSIYNMKDAQRGNRNAMTLLGVFVYGFIILISLICIANILNTVSTNIGLRRREFAMLRSVGMTPKGFNRMIHFESIFYGLKGLLWGLPISVAIAVLLYKMQLSVVNNTFTLPWGSYGFAVLMILVIVLTTMAYSTYKIRKENIIDALKDETF